jgi:hypothetical protein
VWTKDAIEKKSIAMKNKIEDACMWQKTLLLVLAFQLTLTANCQEVKWNSVPGKSAGPITAATSEKKLKMIFGEQNVVRVAEDQPYGEPPEISVTRLLRKGIPYATVYWRNEYKRDSARSVLFYGEGQCIVDGVNLVRITLDKLEEANGKAITMSGLHAYEDRGQLAGWGGGRFAKHKGKFKDDKMEIRLDYCSFEGPRKKCDESLENSDFISSADVRCKSDICVMTVEIFLNK